MIRLLNAETYRIRARDKGGSVTSSKPLGSTTGWPTALGITGRPAPIVHGMSVFDIQAEGGWRDIKMVERYTKSRPFEELQRLRTPLSGVLGKRAR